MDEHAILEQRFGISTFWCPREGRGFEEAATAIHASRFEALEIVPCDYQMVPGNPSMKSVGLDIDALSDSRRRELRDLLGMFSTVTAHAPHRDLNLASANRGIRQETSRQFLDVLSFAIDIGVKIVTFHHGHQTFRTREPDEVIAERNIDFARAALELVGNRDVTLGFEVGNFDILKLTLDGIGDSRFGLLLDVGHTGTTDNALKFLHYFRGRVVEVHLHGTRIDDHGLIHAHESLERNTLLDFGVIMPELRCQDFQGPFICEILSKDLASLVRYANESRQIAIDAWLTR